ncbi:hypothetical protein VRRI112168_03670 [Vreelandella rituensis]|uniref:Uncharacterized protein n=1 Tax=Vreelandella rituensis TaxID=2282306 RepID=A0A368U9G7_9GAMM|nr:hypothetical protein [Halomonas rituensis]RCV93750.1 hypothetical protein DU506_00935 [Halomonas rituensis]
MLSVPCLHYDQWIDTPLEDLKKGDLVRVSAKLLDVLGPVYVKDGTQYLPATPHDQQPIRLMVGEYARNRQHICMVMDMCLADLHEFPDGTALIGNLAAGSIFSPRLSEPDLETFCKKHISRYRAFADDHEHILDTGEVVPITPWWEPMLITG